MGLMGRRFFPLLALLALASTATTSQPLTVDTAGHKLAPNTTSTWEGTLTRDTFSKGKALKGPGGETIAFSVVTDGAGAATMVNLQVTANGATLSAGNELQCFSGGLITGMADSAGGLEIFPAGDGYLFSFSDDTPGGGLGGEEFFSNVNGSGSLEGPSFDFSTGQPVDLDINQARGNVNFNFLYSLEEGQTCGEGGTFTGGKCSRPCSWFWDAQCVTNCDGNGKIRIELDSYEVDETAGSLDINLVRIQGSIGEVTVDFGTEMIANGAASGLDYTSSSGTATWADGDSAPKVVTIPILPDAQIEGPEDFLLTIDNVTGGAELGAVTTATITIDDRPDLAPSGLMLDLNALQKNGASYVIPDVTAVITNIAEGGQNATGATATATDTGGSFDMAFNLPDLAPQQSTQIQFDYDVTSALQAGDGLAAGNQLVITVDEFDLILERSETNNVVMTPAAADVRPLVELMPSLTLENHFFLNGPVATGNIVAAVDWNGPNLASNGDPPYGDVTFNLNGDDTVVPGTASGAMTSYNLGSDLMTGFGCENNNLIVLANQDGFESEPVSRSTTGFDFPLWVEYAIQNIPGADASFMSMVMPPIVKYAYSLVFPEPPFTATVAVPALVPYFGTEIVGILETVASVNVLAESSGMGTVGLAGTTGVAVASFEIVGTLSGEGKVQFKCGESLDLLATTFGLDVTGSITREQALLEIFPGVSALTAIPLIGDYIDGVLQSMIISGKIGARAAITATFEPDASGEFQFASGTGRVALPVNATLTLMPLNNVTLILFGGGEPFVMVKVPAPYFDKAGIQFVVRGQIDIYGYGAGFSRAVNCELPGGCTVSDMAFKQAPGSAPWQLLPRPYVASKDYARFVVQPRKSALGAGDTETTLVSNTFPRPRLALASGAAGRRLLVYVHDDPADPDGRSTEIRSLFHNGADWQPPAQIADDVQPEFAPVVAFDGLGNGIAVWERSSLTGSDPIPDFDLAFAQSLEVVSSVWNGSAWSAPAAITSNSEMDHSLQIASGSDGAVTAVWQRHSGNNLLGDGANPVAIDTATWNGAAWSGVSTVTTGLTGLMQTALAQRDANTAALAFVRDTGSSGGFSTDSTELFLATFDGISWSAPVQITSDGVSDSAPALAYDSTGSLHLLWTHDGELTWLRDSSTIGDARMVRAGSTDAGFLNVQLVADATGNLALVWPFSQGDGVNTGFLIYDPIADQWSQAQALQGDEDVEGMLTAAFGSDGTLQVAYVKTAVMLEDQVITTPETGTFTAENVPVLGASDLVYFEHVLGPDASVTEVELTPGNILPNQDYELSVAVTNSGDFTIDTVRLEVYQNGGLIETQDVTALVAGETRMVTINDNLGPDTKQTFRAIVDPQDALAEKDETNNEKTLQLGGPIFDTVFANGFE